MYFSEKKYSRCIYQLTKEGENICPSSKIIYMEYLLILLGRMFLTLKHVVNNINKYRVKTIF